jgi:hypothetical protein
MIHRNLEAAHSQKTCASVTPERIYKQSMSKQKIFDHHAILALIDSIG